MGVDDPVPDGQPNGDRHQEGGENDPDLPCARASRTGLAVILIRHGGPPSV